METADDEIPWLLKEVLMSVFLVLSGIIAIAVVTPLILVVIPIFFLVLLFIQRLYLQTSRQVKRLESVTKSPIYSLFGETLLGISTIRAFKRQKMFLRKCQHLVDLNGQAWWVVEDFKYRWKYDLQKKRIISDLNHLEKGVFFLHIAHCSPSLPHRH